MTARSSAECGDMSQHSKRELQAAGQYLRENGLAWGNAGNMSVRTEAGYLITASGTNLGMLGEDDFVECALDGSIVSGAGRPSKETPMHRAIYESRAEINAVLHASPFYSTLAACSEMDLPADWFVEDMYYLERVARVAYFHPGSVALGEAVREKAHEANILLMENHGVLVYDISTREALMAMHTLEMVCKMAIAARGASIVMRPLPGETVDDFLNHSGYRPRRQWLR